MPTKGLTSPEGMIMLAVAGLLDISGFCIFILGTWFGVDDYGILEIIGITIMGLWMFMRHGPLRGDTWSEVKEERKTMASSWEPQQPEPKSTKAEKDNPGTPQKKNNTAKNDPVSWKNPKEIVKSEAKQLAIKTLKRFGLTFIVELIPFLGGFWPGWTIFVWKEMREK